MAATITAMPVGIDNVYMVRDRGIILIDGGQPHKEKVLPSLFQKLQINPRDVRLIVLTHGHWDHVGCASHLKAMTGAPLAVHHAERERVENPMPKMPPGITTWGKISSQFFNLTIVPLQKIPPTPIDIAIPDEGMSLEPYGVSGRIVHTPGHSPGSVTVLLDSGEALAGDLVMNLFWLRFGPGFPIYAEQKNLLRGSIEKLISLGAKTFYPAHGHPIAVDKLQRALNKLS